MTTDTLTPALRRLLAALSQPERRRLAQRIAAQLQASNAARIAQQRNPDGTPYQPRKPQPARYPAAQGKIRQALFTRLRNKQHLRIRVATANLVEIGFSPRDERIARIHHYGLMDQVSPHLKVRYPIRQLLGITSTEAKVLSTAVTSHLEKTP